MKAVTIPKRLVDGLIKWNGDGFLTSFEFDRRFLKALIISCIGQKNVLEGQIHEPVFEFIKGFPSITLIYRFQYLLQIEFHFIPDIFNERLKKGNRTESDGALLRKCIDEIASENFC